MTVSSKIRVGLIGVGNWAEYGHLPAFKLLPDFELTAVHSRDPLKAANLAQRHGIRFALDSVEALVNHPEVDLVVVLNTAPQHEATVRAAIAAGKDVYCEWPLTPNRAVSQELLELAQKATVRHIAGLQRRLNPEYRYVHDLLSNGYIGELRSVRLHISVEKFQQQRTAALHFTIPPENFSSLLSIYGGHYFDALFTMLGHPTSISALTVNQFPEVTLIETGEVLKHTTADQVVLNGTFSNGAVLTTHIEAGKRNNYGIQLDLTGTKGDIKIWNTTAFGSEFYIIEAAQGDAQPMRLLKVPPRYNWLPENSLDGSQQEMANLYAAYAKDVRDGTHLAPTFADALRMHDLIDAIETSNRDGVRLEMVV
ncbi:Gfo/Idh/MocA family oxidoreductase [Pseudomonas sp. BN102]|uniref:Gfo/Idh/MocA family protein n=1 Tax=Pseudomonas sp. BN102 TaxID=2567886 RepID=UPI002456ABBC|nr:Gfo/Idh/MocA family oxidoreductase [Pseudomonas sp. BN102]MDH4612431.1 Gfo/Idh/MocA family oxidoreductase [Pseudomonas sp. BN102]